MDCIDPGEPKVFRGSEILIPGQASMYRCPECEKGKTGRNTILFRGVLKSGTLIEVMCRRCKALIKFRAGE
jgi:hypothetical protein